MKFLEQFAAANRVSTPLVAVRTFDQKSTMDSVNGLYSDRKAAPPAIVWDAVNGFRPANGTGKKALEALVSKAQCDPTMTVDLAQALRVAAMVEKVKECDDTLFFMANIHLFWTDGTVIQGIWNLRDVFKANGSMLVLMTNAGAQLPPELVSDVLVLDEPLPTEDDLKKIIFNTYEFANLSKPDDATMKLAIDALIGLPSFPAEQATAMCLDVKSKSLDIKELWARKRQTINQTPGLSVWEGGSKLDDMGGLTAIKDFLRKICNGNDAPTTILFMDEIEKAYAGTGTDTSGVKTELTGRMLSWTQDKEIDGMIWIGVPGGGKSQLVKNTGAEFNIPVINFDLAGMQGSLVGQSGANLRAAQATVDAISGGKILMIATCNSINALPPELRRRFNLGIFFFDVPTSEERNGIWKIYRNKYSIKTSDKTPHDEGWTGAEIKECCKKAYRLKISLEDAAKYIVPVTQSSAELIENLRRSSVGKYLSATNAGAYSYTADEIEVTATGRDRKMKG
jgi:hypothetical protein